MIDVEFFPFDIQSCYIKFSSWTYDLTHMFLTHPNAKHGEDFIQAGIDYKNYKESDEWDLMYIVAKLNTEQGTTIKKIYYPGF